MAVTEYVWNAVHDTVLAETDENGAPTAVYTNEPVQYGNLVSQRRDDQTNYYHFDGQGSSQALTDQNETVTDTYTYSAFGEEVAKTGTTENSYRYVGEKGYQYDADTGDFYVRARSYSPAMERWRSVDPTGFVAGINQYLYAKNEPVFHVDPSGQLEQTMVEKNIVLVANGRLFSDTATAMCGGYNFVTDWVTAKVEASGVIIQKVISQSDIDPCDPKEKVTPVPIDDIPGANTGFKCDNYYELWFVKRGMVYPFADLRGVKIKPEGAPDGRDWFAHQGYTLPTKGRQAKQGEAVFIALKTVKASLAFYQRVFGRREKGVRAALFLFSACASEELDAAWEGIKLNAGKKGVSNMTTKDLVREWDCCEKGCKTLEEVFEHRRSAGELDVGRFCCEIDDKCD